MLRAFFVGTSALFSISCQDIPQQNEEPTQQESQAALPSAEDMRNESSVEGEVPQKMTSPIEKTKATSTSLTDDLKPTQNSSEALGMAVDILRPSIQSIKSDIVEAAFKDFSQSVEENEQTLINYIALTLKHGENVSPEEKDLTCLALTSLAMPLSTLGWHVENESPENLDYINSLMLKSLGYIQVSLMHVGCEKTFKKSDLFAE